MADITIKLTNKSNMTEHDGGSSLRFKRSVDMELFPTR